MKDAPATSDPATFEIVKNSLFKIAEEMRVVLCKTAYSPILKSAGDFSCGVFDRNGDMVAQGPDLPIHLGSMPDAVRAVVAAFGALGPSRSLVLVVSGVLGMAAAIGRQGFDAMVQTRAPAAVRGRAFARFETRFQVAWVIGAITPAVSQVGDVPGAGSEPRRQRRQGVLPGRMGMTSP